MKDFGEGIRKAISNLSRAAEKCVKEYEKFEKYSNITLSEYEKKIEVKDTTGPPRLESDWKILDVNCLEPDFFIVGKYEIKQINGQLEIPVINREQYQIGLMIVGILQDNKKYHYRPTPTKKTHEELAEEMRKGYINTTSITTEQELFVKSVTRTCDFSENTASARGYYRGFIAGRKAMESES